MANQQSPFADRVNQKAQNPGYPKPKPYDSGVRVQQGSALAEPRQGAETANNWMQNQFNSDQAQQTPLLTNAGRETWDLGAGTTRAVGGLFSGDWDQAKSGLKQAGGSIMSALTLGSLRSLNQAPPQQYIGGSPEALAARRDMYLQGIGQGNDMMGMGAQNAGVGMGMLTQAGGQAMQDRAYGYGLADYGLGGQGAALQNSRMIAAQPTDSLAQIQLNQGLAQAQQAMLGQASAARGGNQAAAIRSAQLGGANMALQTNQQAAALRAAEQQAMINRQLGVEQLAAQMGGQQLGLGLGAAQQGTAQLGQFGGQIGSIGLGQGQLGLGSQGQYLGALSGTDKEQLQADTQHASAKKASQGGIMGVAGKVIGSIFGG